MSLINEGVDWHVLPIRSCQTYTHTHSAMDTGDRIHTHTGCSEAEKCQSDSSYGRQADEAKHTAQEKVLINILDTACVKYTVTIFVLVH